MNLKSLQDPKSRFLVLGWLGLFIACAQLRGDEPMFLYGVNLNGPALYIDGHAWEGQDSTHYRCDDKAFENQSVKLVPPTDAARAKMIRSSRWGGNRVELRDLPNTKCTLFLYVWEDNRAEKFDILVNGQVVLQNFNSGRAGQWQRLGPWLVEVTDGQVRIESRGGAANFSGIEVWRGQHDGQIDTRLQEEDLAFFEKRIRPLLVDHCYECHASDAPEVQGELLVDSLAAIRRGGSNGPAVVPGDLDNSLLIQAVRYRNDELRMPPDAKLSDLQIKDLEEWVARGAPDPRTQATRFQRKAIDLTEAKKFWSLQPLVEPPLPATVDTSWPATEIDQFVLAKMEGHQLRPGPPADRRSLIRRATYDLIGLPPTLEEVEDFVQDPAADAFAKVIDRLLDSPHYGQRWGRFWLDVVRYADTAGDNSDFPIPQMHLYRDWVIDSFNADLPYDQFVRAQLAGDLLPSANEGQRRQQVIATGYIANSRRFGSRVDDYPQHLTIEDTLDNFGRALLGLTINCARCHDHKFDPISTDDYYGLYGIFSSTRYPWPGIELEQRQRDLVPLASPETVLGFETEKAQQQKELDADVKRLESLLSTASTDAKADIEQQLKVARDVARKNSQREPPYELIYGVSESAQTGDAAVQIKGDPNKPGDVIRRRFPAVLGGHTVPEGVQTSGRLQLVDWLFDPRNPLPARVMVNRIWLQHFGKGIVPTPNDFGRQGKPPTHPELLDWLATQFRRDGWSIKSLHRRIMLSRTYQLSSGSTLEPDGNGQQTSVNSIDANNDWLSVFPRRRLDAEALRDSLLVLGDNLDRSPAGAHPFPPQSEWKFTQHNPFKAEYTTQRRSVYLMTQRIQRHSYLAIFDGADPSASTPLRTVTTTPLQALYLLNDQWVHAQAGRLADRLMAEGTTDEQRIERAFLLCLARPAKQNELEQSLAFLAAARSRLGTNHVKIEGSGNDESQRNVWQAFVRVMFRLNEFVYLD